MPEEPQLHKTCDKFQNIMFGMSRLIDLVFIYFFSNFIQESSWGTVRRHTPTPMGTFGVRPFFVEILSHSVSSSKPT